MKQLTSYHGGKQMIARKVVNYLPPHTVYAEPFCGGASVLFNKGLPPDKNTDYYREALNDHNRLLYTMYRVAQTAPDQFLQQLQATPYSKTAHDHARDIIANAQFYDDLAIAWAVWVALQMGFQNSMDQVWARSKVKTNKGHNHARKLQTLPQALDRLQTVYLDCLDALQFIEKWDSPHVCFYCDPPYPGATQGHYGGYTQADFEALVDKLATAQASFVLSNYDNAAVPDDWQKIVIQKAKPMRNRKRHKRAEVIWIVDRSHNAKADLVKHLWAPGAGYAYREGLPLLSQG